MHNGLARPSAFGGGGCCWLETERGSVGASDTHKNWTL